MNSLRKDEGVPLLNIEGDPGSRVSKSRGSAPTFTPCRSLGTFGWCNFFSPKYIIGQQSRCLILKSRQRSAWKVQLVHRDHPKLCPKSVWRCEHCRIAFKATDILLVKTVGVREITDKAGSKKKFSGNVYMHYLTKCLREYDLNFTFKMVSVPKGTQEKLPEWGREQSRKKRMILDWNAS